MSQDHSIELQKLGTYRKSGEVMIELFSFDDTQFVADTINRDTVERAHAILTGLIERGWKPPLATGGLVDSSKVYRVGEDRDCAMPRFEPPIFYGRNAQLARDMGVPVFRDGDTGEIVTQPFEPKISEIGTEDTTP